MHWSVIHKELQMGGYQEHKWELDIHVLLNYLEVPHCHLCFWPLLGYAFCLDTVMLLPGLITFLAGISAEIGGGPALLSGLLQVLVLWSWSFAVVPSPWNTGVLQHSLHSLILFHCCPGVYTEWIKFDLMSSVLLLLPRNREWCR